MSLHHRQSRKNLHPLRLRVRLLKKCWRHVVRG
jgi:hypothetical protein